MPKRLNLLQQKTSTIVTILERRFGTPVLPKRRAKLLDMLIATLLSQNTNDKNSHRAYTLLRATFPAWEKVLTAPRKDVISAIRIGGMANRKSLQIKNLLKEISKRFGSLSLDSMKRESNEEIFSTLCSFEGVGPKTAACVLLFSLGRDAFPVDTHVHRICGRLGLSSGCTTPDKTFARMKELVPSGKSYSFHINLIRFGRAICRSGKPLCGTCPLFEQCRFKKKHQFRHLTNVSRSKQDFEFMLLDHV